MITIDNLMWIVTGIAIIGNIFIIKMNKIGYIFWIVSNISMAIYNIYKLQYAQGALFIFYIVMSVIGYISWNGKEKDKEKKKIKSKWEIPHKIDYEW
jgi:nicotinamide riboside transporter PnuC